MNAAPFHGSFSCLLSSDSCIKLAKKVLLNGNFIRSRASSSKCRFTNNDNTSEPLDGFSILKRDIQGEIGSVWSYMGFYVLSIHVPLSFGGISAAAYIVHQPVLDPQIEVLDMNSMTFKHLKHYLIKASDVQIFLMLGIQTLELSIVLHLLKYPGKPQYDLRDLFRGNKSSKKRSWLLASVLGFGFLLSVLLITSYLTDMLIGPKDMQNPFLMEFLSSGSSSITACILVYCLVTPLLEEIVYRGFLLTSLASKMEWQWAVTINSLVFSAAHFSVDNFLQLFIVGLVLGCSYCWTANLSAPIAIHSLYNALILLLTYVS